ncbi:PAS domain S-box-containing protein [Maribacter sedimenticola]|uniref:histidine kinase n=1 Tax=Maribacter sedimenticola TaxID=228956 RepID=A0ABY1SE83_9FLAO|nr:ATP-binding protein [Maribacter sedimenticola]SNR30598.1 PAS domain S-box-containing protein [Maribacter sedimenticola]
MADQKATPLYVKNVILFSIAFLIAAIIYIIDINVPSSIAIGAIYSLVILYSWILPTKNISIYIGILCTILIILGMTEKSTSLPQGSLEGVNTFIAIIVVWVCVTLVSAAKSGYAGLEKVLLLLEKKVFERTRALLKSQKELEVSERIYSSLYENSNEMLASIKNNNEVIRCNETLANKLGYSKDEILGRSIEFLHHKDSLANLKNILEGFSKGKSIKNAELRLKTNLGKPIDVILNVSSSKENDGAIAFKRFSWTDITELKRIENERIAYAEKLEAKNKELEQFAFIASHDLQEPLRTVTSFSELLSNEYRTQFDETGKDSLNFILEATGRMQNLVKALLDYSRIGKDAEMQQVNFIEIIEDLKKDLSLKITETNTLIEYDVVDVAVMGYKDEVRQLFLNLILNAIKFGKKEVSPIIKISSFKKENEIQFCIADNGIGISKDHQHKIFKIFKRLHSRNEYDGTGIGLAHCQKIIDLHGGKIWVESSLGQGSKFFFTLKT